jgi:hypothetical protein
MTLLHGMNAPSPFSVSELKRTRRHGNFQCVWCGRQPGRLADRPFAWVYWFETRRRRVTLPGMFCSDACCASYHSLRR